MTYFGFLALFLGFPILILAALAISDQRKKRRLPSSLTLLPFLWVILIHVVVAVVYTTPWDNYLVASGVWYYNPSLVTGLRLGWVPIEEYTFFVLQTIFFGLWYLFLVRRISLPKTTFQPSLSIRLGGALLMAALSLLGIGLALSRLAPWTYFGLILLWAGPPIAIQFGFGLDILWHYRKLIFLTIIPCTIYLGLADTLAIRSGTWTIAPSQSLQAFLPGGLPLEELLFFFATNCLIGFGTTLALACLSGSRFSSVKLALSRM